MAHPIEIKQKAKSLRRKGYSIKEVAKKIGIAQSTASVWLNNIILDKKACERLEKRKLFGYYKRMRRQKQRKQEIQRRLQQQSQSILKNITFDTNLNKLLSAILFWAEGAKSGSHITFINSDPIMIAVFMKLLRSSFALEEEKFRALVHVHEYHNEDRIKKFWSHTANIPLKQFTKSYKKPHTKKRKKEGYKGTISIRYYDVRIARELRSLYNTLAQRIGV